MPAVTLDLDGQIDNLRGFKDDLQDWFAALEGPDLRLRYAVDVAIGQLAHRIAALEAVARHHDGETVKVGELAADEVRALERAMLLLDGDLVVESGTPGARVWARVRGILAAADDVLLAAARGARTESVAEDGGPRPGVVLPLARSGR